ncbi:MAG: hypothetical protein M3Q50_12950 [Chloroflexota bacterium]|nr:hypothetical protein [Chloroflexota bacterium]
MRVIEGKRVRDIPAAEIATWANKYQEITVDLGAGDGRFVRHQARQNSESGAIAVDLCETTLRAGARAAADNAMFVVADALTLPREWGEIATRVSINFPWGSLLRGLIRGDERFLDGLIAVGRRRAAFDFMVNAGALAETGLSLDAAGNRIMAMLRNHGVSVGPMAVIGAADLRRQPTSWAKRLAFGRDPRAIWITAKLI